MQPKPTVIYLDQWVWSALTDAYYERSKEKSSRETLEKIINAVTEKKAVFPITDFHLLETRQMGVLESRRQRLKVVGEITQGVALAPTGELIPKFVYNEVAKLYGGPELDIQILGRGPFFAYGIDGNRLRIAQNLSEEQFAIYEKIFASPEGLMSYVSGTSEEQNTRSMQKLNQSKQKYVSHGEEIRQKQREGKKAEAYRNYIINSKIFELTSLRLGQIDPTGQAFDTFLNLSSADQIQLLSRVPIIDVETKLSIERNKDPKRPIEPNDLIDVSYLSVAIPYCDVIVTERYWYSISKTQLHLDERYEAAIIKSLAHLEPLLPN